MPRITNEQINAKLSESRESQDRIFELMATNARRLESIHVTLGGTEYERQNGGGGMVADVRELKECNLKVKLFMERTKTRNRIIYTFSSVLVGGLWTLIIAKWDQIFK